MGRTTNAPLFGVWFLTFLSVGLLCVLGARLMQKSYLAVLSRFPRLARFVVMKNFIASEGYIWLVRLAGAVSIATSFFWLAAAIGAFE